MESSVEDWRELSLLNKRRIAKDEILAGMASAFVGAFAIPLVIAASSFAFSALLPERPTELPPLEVIETRFVKLGSDKPQKQLPDINAPLEEVVPEQAPAPPEPMPAEPAPAEVAPVAAPSPKAKPDKPATTSSQNLLEQLGESADTFSKYTQRPQREGDSEGIEEGTAKRGEADIYPGKLYAYFRRGWQVPVTLSADEKAKLSCVVQVTISSDGHVEGFEIAQSSGHAGFDASVAARMAQSKGAKLPDPPEDEAARFLGRTIALRFLGKHAR